MTVKHTFEGVPNGENYTVSGPDSAKGSDEPLKMSKRTDDDAMDTENIAYRPGILIDQPGCRCPRASRRWWLRMPRPCLPASRPA